MGHNVSAQHNELQQRFIDIYTTLNDLLEYLQINREVRCAVQAPLLAEHAVLSRMCSHFT